MNYLPGSKFVGEHLNIRFSPQPDQSIIAQTTLTAEHEGPPDHVHGGASAAIIDEAMGLVVWYAGLQVVAANLNINLRAPVPLHQEITIIGKVERVEGRKVFTSAQILLADGTLAVEGQGLFVEAPHLFTKENDMVRGMRATPNHQQE